MSVKRKIDFTNTEDGRKLLPTGDYKCNVFDIADKPSKAGDPGVNVTLKVAEGEYKGQTLFYYLSELPQVLWKVRGFLEACGAQIPKKAVVIDYDKCLGKKIVVTVGHREWNNKTVADVTDVQPLMAENATEDGAGSADDDDEVPF